MCIRDSCRTVLEGVTSKGIIQTILRIKAVSDDLVEQYQAAGGPKNFDRTEVGGVYIVLEAVNAFLGKLQEQISSKEDTFLLWVIVAIYTCLLYTSPSPRDRQKSRMPSSA
eukprot:TRINITY_DN7678_c0_g1_i2.p1 TRINITY_DN7678_c0_g1~~TRINITY_DN7678_c0_g1_i2.p1  ORF type:complete len:111 (+),score=26.13 TRINITY_DN7678_c0_g1_i2:63-395(+)